jgi:hypothetical protein
MTTTQKLMDELKATRGLKTDYQVAKLLDLSTARTSAYRAGTRHADEYVCTRMAVELGKDPAAVIAQVALDRERNPKRLEWWKSFLLRALILGQFTLGASCSAFYAPEVHAKTDKSGISFTKQHIVRNIRKMHRKIRRFRQILKWQLLPQVAVLQASAT